MRPPGGTGPRVIWVDVALVFGPQVPLLFPLVLAAVTANWCAHRLGEETIDLSIVVHGKLKVGMRYTCF